MASIRVTLTVNLTEDAEHTEDQKVDEVMQLIRAQADAVRRTYDEGIQVVGTMRVSDTDEEAL